MQSSLALVVFGENASFSKDKFFKTHGSATRTSCLCNLCHNSVGKLSDFSVVKYTNGHTWGQKKL